MGRPKGGRNKVERKTDANGHRYVFGKCIDCGKEVKKRIDQIKTWQGRCVSCSIKFECAKPHRKEMARQHGINRFKKHGQIPNGNRFKKGETPWNKGMKGFLGGEKHYNWQGGKSFEEYSREWTSSLKTIIRERDNYTCQICGKVDVKIVHHIDYDKKNSKENNLITLCQSCHIKTNYRRNYWKNYFEEKTITNKEKL